MRIAWNALAVTALSVGLSVGPARGDSATDGLVAFFNDAGRDVWGPPPPACDDLTFARRLYLDVLGRVPSVAEIRDYTADGPNRRDQLIEQLVFGVGPRGATYDRLRSNNLAKHWRRVLLPPGTTVTGPTEPLERFLATSFGENQPYDELITDLALIGSPTDAGGYFGQLGGLPENLAGHLSRVALGIRIECAQCHDHPFTRWRQSDFWGLAAYYGDLGRPAAGDSPAGAIEPGEIGYEGQTFPAKPLWGERSQNPTKVSSGPGGRGQLASWMTAADNQSFTATAVNRFWQHLVGRGMIRDVENLDQAFATDREMVDQAGRRFAEIGFDVRLLIAAICRSDWYQAEAEAIGQDPGAAETTFVRHVKAISPEQVFNSLEQSLQLPVGRINDDAARWSGDRMQLVSRLSETVGATPEEYAAGIPQALMLMNGKMTGDAIRWDSSQLLRSVVEAPFFDAAERIDTLYLAVLTRRPTDQERLMLMQYIDDRSAGGAPGSAGSAYGEILWALLNSPEFVLCR